MPGAGGRNLASQNRKIFIGGLNYNSTEDSLKSYFGKFGDLVDVVVMKFPDTKRSRGFGFITYTTDEEVDACQENRPHVIDGKQVETKRATPREAFGTPEAGLTVKKVFVGGIKEDVDDADIKAYFEEFGPVATVTRMTDKETGKKRGFAFVEFNDYDPVDKAILKGKHQINGKHVDVKKAVSKQDMNGMGGGGGGQMGGRGGRGSMGRGGNMGRGGGGRGGWNGGPANNGGGQWGGGYSTGGSGGWGNNFQGGAPNGGGWGGAPNNNFYQPGNADWNSGPNGYGGGPAGGGYHQGGFGGGGPMRAGAGGGGNGGFRAAPYGGGPGNGAGFRGNRGGRGRM